MHAIKKYPNRRMYDALLKKYVNLDEVMGFIQHGDTVQITDSQTGIDVTVETLLFHICNSELLSILCPVDWLFQLARLQEGDERRQYLSYCLVTRHMEPESVTEEHSSENTEVMYTRKISPNSKKYSMEEVSSDEEMIEKSVPRDDSDDIDDMDDMDDISDNPMKNTKIPSLYVVRNTLEPSGHTTHHDVPEVVPPKAQESLEMVDADLPEEQTTPKEENSLILPIEEPENANLVFVHPEIPTEEKAPVDIGVFEHIASIEVAHVSGDVFSTTGEEEKDVSSTQMEEAVIAEVPSTNTETQEAEVDMSSAKARLMALQARFKK